MMNEVMSVYKLPHGDQLLDSAPEIIEKFLASEQDASSKRNAFLMLFSCAQDRAVNYLFLNIDRIIDWGEQFKHHFNTQAPYPWTASGKNFNKFHLPGCLLPWISASFATPAAGSTSYASPTCDTPSPAQCEEVNKVLIGLQIDPMAIPDIVGAITSKEVRGLLYSRECRLTFAQKLQRKYYQPQPQPQSYQSYQPYDFR
ncbi:hypothetical protein TSUD_13260 [Trifolium subterraneum]|uniref:Uncharacterized protein n=1 Tax=Trifolium subterraneum TaxID=3900 RepID=A0A2Z6NDU6_TRISU|nr:hypothetical protein TSUD_13260 [Trifolium subterraneum]